MLDRSRLGPPAELAGLGVCCLIAGESAALVGWTVWVAFFAAAAALVSFAGVALVWLDARRRG